MIAALGTSNRPPSGQGIATKRDSTTSQYGHRSASTYPSRGKCDEGFRVPAVHRDRRNSAMLDWDRDVADILCSAETASSAPRSMKTFDNFSYCTEEESAEPGT